YISTAIHHSYLPCCILFVSFFFFFLIVPPPTGSSPLSLHDALPILWTTIQTPAGQGTATFDTPSSSWVLTQGNSFDVGIKHDFQDRKSTRLNSSHVSISYAVFCLKKKKKKLNTTRNPRSKRAHV